MLCCVSFVRRSYLLLFLLYRSTSDCTVVRSRSGATSAGVVSHSAADSLRTCALTPVKPHTSAIYVTGSVYTKHQRCDNCAKMLAILFSLKTMELLQVGVATQLHCFPMRTESLPSLQNCRSTDTGAWCKWTLNVIAMKCMCP